MRSNVAVSQNRAKYLHLGILTCTACGEQKLLKDFTREPRNPVGYKARCKSCIAASSRKPARISLVKRPKVVQVASSTDPDARLRWHLWGNYGITLEQYRTMEEEQSYRCKICQKTAEETGQHRLSVDHDHETKVVRGLLCANCNQAIGKFFDSPDLLARAIKYLAA